MQCRRTPQMRWNGDSASVRMPAQIRRAGILCEERHGSSRCGHQFGGAIHEGTHYMLFANRKLNELASDWLAAFPIYTTTYHFRLHHLAHHQFVNDPERDPDISQLHESDHWLDFPITHVDMLVKLLKQLWLPNLIRYTLTRARYSATGGGRHKSPYTIPDQPPSHW